MEDINSVTSVNAIEYNCLAFVSRINYDSVERRMSIDSVANSFKPTSDIFFIGNHLKRQIVLNYKQK